MKEKILRNKKNLLLIILVIGVLAITISFAALATNLKLTGTANVDSTKWNIHFDNWTNVTENTTLGHQNTAQYDDTKITQTLQPNVTKIDKVNVVLKQPGDYIRYTFKIKNDGSIDGQLDRFSHTVKCEENKNCDMIDYSITCTDTNNNNALETGYILEKNKNVDCTLEVKYKDQTNSNTAGSNQKYEQEEVETEIQADWTWVQEGTNTPGAIIASGVSTQGQGQFLKTGTTGWKWINPGSTLENQQFEYWRTPTSQIMYGWHELLDYYGKPQEYYFIDGIAQKGWLEYNGKSYYLSTFDDDGNNFTNFNLLKDTTFTDPETNKCYHADSYGVATETACQSNAGNWDKYYYYSDSTGILGQYDSRDDNWPIYVQVNTTTGDREVCGKFSNGTRVCAKSGQYSCTGGLGLDSSSCDKTYINSFSSQFAAAGATLNPYSYSSSYMYGEDSGYYVSCSFDSGGNVSFTAMDPDTGRDIECSDNISGPPYCRQI